MLNYKELLSHIQKTLADSYNDINIFEIGPSTMKNLDDLYGDDEENILLDDTNAAIMKTLCNIGDKINNIVTSAKDPTTRTFLTGKNLSGTLVGMSSRVDELHDMMLNLPLDDSDKSLISTDTSDDNSDAGSKPGLWDNIRKKKQREGKKYRPAKPGDKDRPDPKQWKKLTDN